MNNQEWFYKGSTEAMGPFNVAQIHDLYLDEVISSNTLVKNAMMSWWIPLDSSVLFSAQYLTVLKNKSSRRVNNARSADKSFLKEAGLAILGVDSAILNGDNLDLTSKALDSIYRRLVAVSILIFLFLFNSGIKFFPSVFVSVIVSVVIWRILPSVKALNKNWERLNREKLDRLAIQEEEKRIAELKKARIEHEDALRKEQERIRQLAEIKDIHLKVDHVRANYNSANECYLRNNKMDKLFVKKYRYHLERISRNKCLNCDEMTDLQLDHAIFPKSMGGSFIMVHKTGLLQANCILLCQSCNSSKGQRDYKVFIKDHKKVLMMHAILAEMTTKLNEPRGREHKIFY